MNIIGIHGKSQHGKNTVASIIQYYTAKESFLVSLEEYLLTDWLHRSENNTWQVKAFADKLKHAASLLTGIPKVNFDNEEFKSKKMSPEWNCWKLSFDAEHNSIEHLIWRTFNSEDQAREYMDDNYIVGGKLEFFTPTYRQFLQIVGTDLCRDQWNPDTWINATFADYKLSYQNDPWYDIKGVYEVSEEDERIHPPVYPNWILSDVRFPNECAAIENREGIVIKVVREGMPSVDLHSSEHALEDYVFAYTLFNDKDIPYLVQQVKEMLAHFKIKFTDY